jgi:hypothetical protein
VPRFRFRAMGSRIGQAEVVHRGLSVYVMPHKLVAHSVIETGEEAEWMILCFQYLDNPRLPTGRPTFLNLFNLRFARVEGLLGKMALLRQPITSTPSRMPS